MPKNVTFREDAVVLMHQKQSAFGEVKNFFANAFSKSEKAEKETKFKDFEHPLIKKSSAIFEENKYDPVTKLKRPSAMF
jgi:hypothetical protein